MPVMRAWAYGLRTMASQRAGDDEVVDVAPSPVRSAGSSLRTMRVPTTAVTTVMSAPSAAASTAFTMLW